MSQVLVVVVAHSCAGSVTLSEVVVHAHVGSDTYSFDEISANVARFLINVVC